MRKSIVLVMIIAVFTPIMFAQDVLRAELDNWEFEINDILVKNGKNYVVATLNQNKQGSVDFNFYILQDVDDSELRSIIVISGIIVGSTTRRTKWTSNVSNIFQGWKKKLAWIYTKHCREAMKIESATGKRSFILQKIQWIKQ